MYGIRICLLAALIVSPTLTVAAEDYVVPDGVTVLTEEQLLNQIIGSTITGGNLWWAYFLPPSGDQKKGRYRGKDTQSRPTSGDWTVNGSLMCWHFDSPTKAAVNGCFTTNLDGDKVTWYLATGHPRYSRYGRITLIAGNPENF